jgi:D-alanine--poly(phosphoribitol) ligase subunit 1
LKINVAEFLLDSAIKWPNRVAIKDEVCQLTYGQLLADSYKLAELLRSRGVEKDLPVILFIPKSCKALVGITSITLAGGIYVPVDSSSPAERLRGIFEKLGDSILLCLDATYDLAVSAGFDLARIVKVPADTLDHELLIDIETLVDTAKKGIADLIDLDPCYVIFTSGSTGSPKGVTISHRSVIDYIEWALGQYPISENHRLASQAPFYFDNSTLDIYLTFASGATLYLPPERVYGFPKLALDYLDQWKITTVFWVPSVLVAIANSGLLGTAAPKSLQHVLFAGEQMPIPQINLWVEALPGVLFSNLYGPTEITVDCTAFTFYEAFNGDNLPIGFACKNTQVLILNQSNKLCADGEIGELCVRGTSLALGYWNDPERSSEVFIQNPLETRFRDLIYRTGDLACRDKNGCIAFMGRIDSQIKLNGYRIELGEVEAAAAKVSGVGRCAAMHDKKRKTITLFIQPLGSLTMELANIRRALSQYLPKYMMPSEIITIEEFDLNQNGKIDRIKLASILESKNESK